MEVIITAEGGYVWNGVVRRHRYPQTIHKLSTNYWPYCVALYNTLIVLLFFFITNSGLLEQAYGLLIRDKFTIHISGTYTFLQSCLVRISVVKSSVQINNNCFSDVPSLGLFLDWDAGIYNFYFTTLKFTTINQLFQYCTQKTNRYIILIIYWTTCLYYNDSSFLIADGALFHSPGPQNTVYSIEKQSSTRDWLRKWPSGIEQTEHWCCSGLVKVQLKSHNISLPMALKMSSQHQQQVNIQRGGGAACRLVKRQQSVY